jgi:membrane protease YdiL (CAAX protease family)
MELLMIQLAIRSLVLAGIGAGVYILTRVLRFDYQPWPFDDPRRAGISGVLTIAGAWALLATVMLLLSHFIGIAEPHPSVRVFNASDVILKLTRALIGAGPILLVMRRRREPLASAGISHHNLKGSLLVGTTLSVLIVSAVISRTYASIPAAVEELGSSHLWALVYFVITGTWEEFAFRGYLQTRLVAWLGRWQGWVVTSVMMALGHIVQRITVESMAPAQALTSSLAVIPTSLLAGYIMLRTENVVAPALFHTFADWASTLT